MDVRLFQQQLESVLAKNINEVVHGKLAILHPLKLDEIGGLGLQVPILSLPLLPLLPDFLLGRLASGSLFHLQ